MEQLNSIISSINAFAWGPPMLGILGVTGVLLTLGLVFMPWRRVGYGFRLLFDKETVGEGEVKPFNALMTALSATVGTGKHCRGRHGDRTGRSRCNLLHVVDRVVRHGDQVCGSCMRRHLPGG